MWILIVDDDRIVRRLMSSLLRSEGYDVVEATDGADAIKASKCYPGMIDLLITDILMPNMDGHDLSRWFRDKQPEIPIVVVSSDKEHEFPPLHVAYSAVLLKPVSRKLLIDTVSGLLEATSVVNAPRLCQSSAE